MGVSKEAMLDAFGRFKELQDNANAEKFVAKEAGKSLISDADLLKLNSIDTSGGVTSAQMQAAVSALASIFGGGMSTPCNPGDNPGTSGGDTIYVTDPDEGDEVITNEDLENLFH